MQLKKKYGSFTLIEVLIAVSIFTTVGLIGLTVFVNVLRTQQRISLENAIYEDTGFMLQRITREIRENAIDYEEYYNKAKIAFSKPPYGTKYGCYAERFYNPGSDNEFGAKCNDRTHATPECTVDKTTLDINTGQNPYAGSLKSGKASAFCDNNFVGYTSCTTPDPPLQPQKELYLISAKGTEKTILAQKAITSDLSPEHALAIVRMTGKDTDNDGVVEEWNKCGTAKKFVCCSDGFDCNDITAGRLEDTLKYDGTKPYKGFVPISPTRTDIKSLNFYIAPLEDPRKAFNETDLNIQQQPHVTVAITTKPAKSVLKGYAGEIPEITLQTTIVSRVYNEVRSFLSKEAC